LSLSLGSISSFLRSLSGGLLHISGFLWAISKPVPLLLTVVTLELVLFRGCCCGCSGFNSFVLDVSLQGFFGFRSNRLCYLPALSLIKLIY